MYVLPSRELALSLFSGAAVLVASESSSPPTGADPGGLCGYAWLPLVLMAVITACAVGYAILLRRQLAATVVEPRDQATHDALTALPNRLLFMEFSRKVLANAQRHGSLFSLLFLEVDDLIPTGGDDGDEATSLLVQAVARRIEDTVRQGDLVARFQDGKFAVLLDSVRGRKGLAQAVKRLLVTVNAPYAIEGKEVTVGCSVGVSFFPHDGDQLSDLMQKADEALLAAQETGGKRSVFYDELPLPTAEGNN